MRLPNRPSKPRSSGRKAKLGRRGHGGGEKTGKKTKEGPRSEKDVIGSSKKKGHRSKKREEAGVPKSESASKYPSKNGRGEKLGKTFMLQANPPEQGTTQKIRIDENRICWRGEGLMKYKNK